MQTQSVIKNIDEKLKEGLTNIQNENSCILEQFNDGLKKVKEENSRILEQFNGGLKKVKEENSRMNEKLDQILASQKRNMIIMGAGFAVLAVLCVLGFIL